MATGLPCSNAYLQNMSAIMQMPIQCSSDIYNTLLPNLGLSHNAVRPNFYDKALIDLHVLEHAGAFCGRSGSSLSYVALLRRHSVYHYPSEHNGLYTGPRNSKVC